MRDRGGQDGAEAEGGEVGDQRQRRCEAVEEPAGRLPDQADGVSASFVEGERLRQLRSRDEVAERHGAGDLAEDGGERVDRGHPQQLP